MMCPTLHLKNTANPTQQVTKVIVEGKSNY